MITALSVLLPALVHSQSSQFVFDAAGNLFAQSAETSAPPQILSQPRMQIVIPGEFASFSVGVADTRGVTYQWLFNGAPIPGATADSLLLANVITNNEGSYSVTVSNPSGSVSSSSANLYVDSDGDGLPDSWEIAHFGNLDQTALGDADGDGVSNLQEFNDGTDPTNAASVLYRIALVNDGGTVLISPNQTTFTRGQVVTLTAIGSAETPFHAWTGDVVTRSNPITVTIKTNLTLFAHFLPFTLLWTNTASSDWNEATNWSPNLVPGNNESVVLTPVATITITENSNVDLVDFKFGHGFGSPALTGSGRVSISGTGQWINGIMSGTGSTIVQPGASLTVLNSPGMALNERTLENAGSVVWLGGSLSLGGVITNDPGAQIQFLGPASINGDEGAARFDNSGVLLLAPNAATTFGGVAFDDYGTVDFPGGTLTLSGGGILASSLFAPADSTVVFENGVFASTADSSLTGPGSLLVSGGISTLGGMINLSGSNVFAAGVMEFTGTYICTNNALVVSGGNVSIDAAGDVSPQLLTVSGPAILGGTQNVTVGSAMLWTGGSMTGPGKTIIPASARLEIDNPSWFISMTGRTLDNAGTILWPDGGSLTLKDAAITNEPGALFQVQGPQGISFGGGSARFDNGGTLRVTGTGTTAFNGVPLNNFNAVDIQGGTLSLAGGGQDTGTITVPAGTGLDLSGTFIASAGSSIAGAGQLSLSGGSANLAGVVNLAGSNIFSAGSVDFTGRYTCTNNVMVISGATVGFDGTGTVSPAIINLGPNGTLQGAQSVKATSSMLWTGGSMAGSGTTLVPADVTLTINNPTAFISITGRTLDNAGTILWAGGGSLSMVGSVITNEPGSLLQVQGPQTIAGGGLPRVDNAGTFRLIGGITTFSAVPLNNFNAVDIQTGTLVLGGGGSNTGNIAVPLGSILDIAGNYTSSGESMIAGLGTFSVSGGSSSLGGTVNVSGTNLFTAGAADFLGNYICTNNTLAISGGAASFDGTGSVSPAVLLLNGTLGGSQNVTVRNAMIWTSGTMKGSGRTIIPPGAALAMSNTFILSLSSRTLDNGGTATWTGSPAFSMTGAVITNEPNALLEVQSSPSVSSDGTSRFDNAGTLRKSGTTGPMLLTGVLFTNYGTLDIQTGSVLVNGGLAFSSNAVLNCALGGTLPGTNYGQLQVTGGTVSLNGTLSVNLANNYIPNVNDTFSVVSASARNGAFARFIYPSNQVAMVLSNSATSVIVRVTNIFGLPQPLLLPLQISGSNVNITWTTTPNSVYRVEYNPGPGFSNWFPLTSDLTALSNTLSSTDAKTQSNRFYRVRALP